MDAEVIIVGGGLSGLSAAKWLIESGVSVLVLEARTRVGGRTYTKNVTEDNYVDLGGSYFGLSHKRLLRMSKELGVENYTINEVEDLLHYKNGQRLNFKNCETPKQRNPLVNMDIANIFYLMNKMEDEIPPDAPWNAPHANEWDTMTYKEFLEKHCWTKDAVDFFNNIMNSFITSEHYEASLLGFLWYMKQCGGSKGIFLRAGAQRRKFKGGAQQICDKVAERLGEAVVKDSPVTGINQESKDVVLVKALNGREYKTKFVILALPPMLQMKIHFSPELPALRYQLIQRAPMGTVMKVILYYSKTFWREKGFSGSFLIQGGDDHPMFFTLDDTKPDSSYPAIMGFISTDKLRRSYHVSSDERKAIIAKSLAEATGCREALNPIHYEEKNWMEEQYSGGGFSAMYPPGFFTRYGRVLREPIGRIYLAGTETAVEWSGYMEGAIEAGERAAQEILYKMGKITRDKIFQKEFETKDAAFKIPGTSFSKKTSCTTPTSMLLIVSTLALLTVTLLKNYRFFQN